MGIAWYDIIAAILVGIIFINFLAWLTMEIFKSIKKKENN